MEDSWSANGESGLISYEPRRMSPNALQMRMMTIRQEKYTMIHCNDSLQQT